VGEGGGGRGRKKKEKGKKLIEKVWGFFVWEGGKNGFSKRYT
jgi:hypothetical protein